MLADRYSLTEPLGSGAMGQVWRAWDTALGRAVAVKLLAAPAGDTTAVQLIMQEAHAAARLTHANIAALYDFGHTADGRPFLVMELVNGRSLADLLAAEGRLAWQRAADLGAQAARALAAAHAAGVQHCDIKPANLLVTDDGMLKVVDFGIAQLTDHATATAGQYDAPMLGTPAYIAPEQALRHPAGPAADLYALGCVLYETLAGQPPFACADAAQVLYRHVHETPHQLDTIRPDAPPQLSALVHALLAKDPADRPYDATDVARQLQATAEAPAAAATQVLPPISDATAPLPPIADTPAPVGARSSSRGRPSQRDRRLPIAVGALLVAGAGLLTVLLLLVGTDDDGDTTAASSATPSVSSATTQSEEPSSPPPATSASPTASATVEPVSAPNPTTLSSELTAAIAAQSGNMDPALYRESQKRAAEIEKKVQEGKTNEAADKASDLSQRLSEAQQKDKWGGDTQIMQLLAQLSASG
ncbi:serine/threonine-protein kinase [Streptomyces sp. NBC_00038]|uniref:serine/threonine-protein kinase n=1 Tax=Streptomyces sp. NBC_00038 TaxID=2903615 RepID=UPI00225C1BA7|nr:protein kinase [Streptomyces sp. NBC_00038]MCX5554862.1 protein kinase [Streptomyces sp. NBC_00038]